MKHSYWNHNGKYEKLYNFLYGELVPHEGKADTHRGEILRIACNLYYDVFNNGGGNFDIRTEEREWLLRAVPEYAKETTKAFIKQPKYGKIPQKYYDLCDKYMNWVILYVDFLEAGEKLQEELK